MEKFDQTMATTMDNLEELTNDALRLRLLEYGFANMPVTSTTRKVLIKKLRNAVDLNQTKTRRETISVTKYSSAEESGESENEKKTSKTVPKTTNRRATIAATSVTTKKMVQPVLPRPVAVAARRAGRTTPSTVSQPILALVENSDDDEVKKVDRSPAKNGRAQTRSPSLSKSGVLTTSYKQMIQPVVAQTFAEEDDEDVVILEDDNDDDEDEEDSINNEVVNIIYFEFLINIFMRC